MSERLGIASSILSSLFQHHCTSVHIIICNNNSNNNNNDNDYNKNNNCNNNNNNNNIFSLLSFKKGNTDILHTSGLYYQLVLLRK